MNVATDADLAAEAETEEKNADLQLLSTSMVLNAEARLNIRMFIDNDKKVADIELKLDGEYEDLTQEMLDAYAEKLIGKTMPATLRADATEITAEESIIEELDGMPELSRELLERLNFLVL